MKEKDQILFQQIDDYLNGQLSDEDKVIMEDKIRNDPEFAVKVKKHRLMIKGIRLHAKDALRKIMSEADRELDHIGKSGRSKTWIYVSLSSAAVLLVAIGIYYLFFHESMSQRIFQEYYHPPTTEILIQARGSLEYTDLLNLTDEDYILAVKAIELYQSKDYKAALSLFKNISLRPESDQKLSLFYAVCELETGNTPAAIRILDSINNWYSPDIEDSIQWYLALCYIKESNYDKAIELLSKLSDSPYTEDAKNILEKLKN